MAIKTTWTEVNQIIKEEFQRLVEKKKIQSRIQQINEELAHMEEEDNSMMAGEKTKNWDKDAYDASTGQFGGYTDDPYAEGGQHYVRMGEGEGALEEVEAGGLEKVDSDTGLEPNVKFATKFKKKGSHLLEDEDSEEEMEDEDGEEGEEEGSLADEFAELGAAIEAKIMAALGNAVETPEEESGEESEEDFEEVEVGEDEVGVEVGEDEVEEMGDEVEVGEDDTIDEYGDEHPIATTDAVGGKNKEAMNESTSKGNKKYLNVLSEGLDTNKKSALQGEVDRMRRLANLGGSND